MDLQLDAQSQLNCGRETISSICSKWGQWPGPCLFVRPQSEEWAFLYLGKRSICQKTPEGRSYKTAWCGEGLPVLNRVRNTIEVITCSNINRVAKGAQCSQKGQEGCS